PDPCDMRRMRFDEYRDRLRVGCNHPFALDLSCPINNADRRQIQRYVQSHIVFHRSSPSLRGHMKMASCVPGELIPRAGVWLDPGITPCSKTILRIRSRKIESRSEIKAQG